MKRIQEATAALQLPISKPCFSCSGFRGPGPPHSIFWTGRDWVATLGNPHILARNTQGSFGFTLTEGALWSVPCISHIKKVKVVSSNLGDISPGDYILAINDVSLAGQPHDETIALLQNSEHVVDLLLLPNGGVYEESILVHDLDTSSSAGLEISSMSGVDDTNIAPRHPLGVVLVRQDAAAGGSFGFSIVGCAKEGERRRRALAARHLHFESNGRFTSIPKRNASRDASVDRGRR